jgi:tRNA A37 threonylcarbamoyladenosine modification protein TsaB
MGARLLAIDTASIACSVALFEDGALPKLVAAMQKS